MDTALLDHCPTHIHKIASMEKKLVTNQKDSLGDQFPLHWNPFGELRFWLQYDGWWCRVLEWRDRPPQAFSTGCVMDSFWRHRSFIISTNSSPAAKIPQQTVYCHCEHQFLTSIPESTNIQTNKKKKIISPNQASSWHRLYHLLPSQKEFYSGFSNLSQFASCEQGPIWSMIIK